MGKKTKSGINSPDAQRSDDGGHIFTGFIFHLPPVLPFQSSSSSRSSSGGKRSICRGRGGRVTRPFVAVSFPPLRRFQPDENFHILCLCEFYFELNAIFLVLNTVVFQFSTYFRFSTRFRFIDSSATCVRKAKLMQI